MGTCGKFLLPEMLPLTKGIESLCDLGYVATPPRANILTNPRTEQPGSLPS
jgi:hypothetical protein